MRIEAIRIYTEVETDGELRISGLPYKKGDRVEIIVRPDTAATRRTRRMTARELLGSDLVGMWRDREDLGDSASFARRLRERVEKRIPPG